MNFEFMTLLMQDVRVENASFWNTHWIEQEAAGNVWPNYPFSEYDALKPDNKLSPQGWALKLLSNYALDQMIGTTSSGKVRVYASKNASGAMNIWLVNKDTVASVTTLTLQNYSAPATGNVSVYKGTSSTDMYPTFTQNAGTVTVSSNTINITLDPVSITIIQLGSGGPAPTNTPPGPTPTRTNTPTMGPSPTRTNTPLPTNTFTPVPPTATPGGATVMHVLDIYTTDSSGNLKTSFVSGETVYWKVKIVDQFGNPVSGAVVDCNIKRPTGANYISSQKRTTDATGWTPLFSKSVNVGSTPGTWTVNVIGVTKTGATYNAAANVKSSASFTDQ